MTQVIYLDADAIINAIDAGVASGTPTSVLDMWLDWADSVGAQIKVTDIVASEVQSHASTFGTWLDTNNIQPVTTSPDLIGVPNAGELSIFYDIQASDPTFASSQIISDNITQLKNPGFVRDALTQVGANGEIDAAGFINQRVLNSSEALNIGAPEAGVSFSEFTDLASAYREISAFDPASTSYNGQRFLGEPGYAAVQSILASTTGDGPIKFGGLEPTPVDSVTASGIMSTAQSVFDGFAGDINAFKAALGTVGQALIAADVAYSFSQAMIAVEGNDFDGAGLILSQLSGRIALGIEGAMVGDQIGTAFGALAGETLSAAIASGALDGALLGVDLGPVGAAVGGLLGALAGAIAGSEIGNDLGAQLADALADAMGALKSAFGGGDDSGAPAGGFLGSHPSPPHTTDPLVLDLTGTGIQLTPLSGSPAYFDFTGSGFANQTGWISSDEGLLVLDDGQGDSTISVSELLGVQSGNGFSDLAALDSNGDGFVDSNNSSFSNLKVWNDADGDAQLDSGELKSLDQLGITSFNLATTRVNDDVNGSTVVANGSFTIDGQQQTIGEVYFATSAVATRYTPPTDFSYDSDVLSLPQLVGYGAVPDLWVAMSLNSTLFSEVENLTLNCGSMSATEFGTGLEAIVQEWAGASDIDPESRGDFVDARHLAVVYAFYGIDQTEQPSYALDPEERTGAEFETVYRSIIDDLTARFVSQVSISQLLNGVDWSAVESSWLAPFAQIKFDPTTDSIDVDFNHLVDSIVNVAPTDPTAASTYYQQTFEILQSLRVDLFGEDDTAFAAAFLTEAKDLGLSRDVEAIFLTAIGRTYIDGVGISGQIDGSAGNDVIFAGTSGNSLLAAGGNDVLVSGAGNDYLEGGNGSDSYVFNVGDGQDTIYDNGNILAYETDTLEFGEGIDAANVTVSQSNGGHDLVLSMAGTTDTVTLQDQLNGSWGGVDEVKFADGSTWDRAALLEASLIPTAGADIFYGDPAANTISGGGGDDALYGAGGDDVLVGGVGNDFLEGGFGNDTYQFNVGDGQDTIYDNGNVLTYETDTLEFGEGIDATDVTVSQAGGGHDLVLSITGATDTVTLQDELDGSWGGVDQVGFADGTIWDRATLLEKSSGGTDGNNSLHGDGSANTIAGGGGNDHLYGAGGNDTLIGGAGNDYLEGGSDSDTYDFNLGDGQDTIYDNGNGLAYETDTLVFGSAINTSDISVTQASGGHDLVLSIAGTTDTVTLQDQMSATYGGVDQLSFADGTTWDRTALVDASLATMETSGADTIHGDYSANVVSGGGGNDNLYGAGGDDTLIGGTGNDYLEGGYGNDTYNFNLGDGQDTIYDNGNGLAYETDTLAFGAGISASDISVTQASGGHDLVLSIAGTTDTVTLQDQMSATYGGVDQVSFADGTTWDRTALVNASLVTMETSGADTIHGDYSANVVSGGGGNDNLYGAGGDDTLIGGTGNDYLEGGYGNDTYNFNLGDGQDTIYDNGDTLSYETDTLAFGTGISPEDVVVSQAPGSSVLLSINGTTDSVTLSSQLSASWGGVDQVAFADGTVWNRATIASLAA